MVKETVFVAMSGGMDSTYAAYLLKEQGNKVVGFTFDLLPQSLRSLCNPKTCCSAATTHRAKTIADSLGISHYVINMREEFEGYVIDKFIQEYKIGRTPNPCVLCNKYVKFASFLKKARAMGADKVATGHYATIAETNRGFELKKGADNAKDQSYFLYPIEKMDLPYLSFPLFNTVKSTVRKEFQHLYKSQERVEESQDICFIPDSDYKTFIGQFISPHKGVILSIDGMPLGHHEGIHFFTIGQRKGINIPYKEPLYVVALNATDNTVIVGPKEYLSRKALKADQVNLLVSISHGRAHAKVRYRQKEQPCSFSINKDVLHIEFDEPILSVTPGQSVVLYEGDTVLGGGTIQ